MKNILILGAGRSAASLIDYLLKHSVAENWQVKIGDYQPSFAEKAVQGYANASAFTFNVFDETQRANEVQQADVVISLLPASFHIHVGKACLQYKKPLFTASYISKEFSDLARDVEEAGLLFLMESGLDPGIDHMTAMQAIDEIRAQGGELFSFKSYTGGLLAPQSEDNPWRYKFTWNPRNVVLAGQGTAQFIRNGLYKYIPYHNLFTRVEDIVIPGYGDFEAYPNRDSLSYRKVYGLEDIPTMLRGTIRRPGYGAAWNLLVRLGLTDDSYTLENASTMTYRQFINAFLAYDTTRSVEEKVCRYFGIGETSEEFQKLAWLGLFEDEMIGLENPTPAQVLQKKLEERWHFGEDDRDMIVMQHQFGYFVNNQPKRLTASLVSIGRDHVQTAMSDTVGWPLAMAVKNYLQGKYTQVGVVRPVTQEIYQPILAELLEKGIEFTETTEDWKEPLPQPVS